MRVSQAVIVAAVAGVVGSHCGSKRSRVRMEMDPSKAIRLDGTEGRWDLPTLCRFDAHEIQMLVSLLQLPAHVVTENRCKCPPDMALFILLCKLSAPLRHIDLVPYVQQSEAWICDVYCTTLQLIYRKWAVPALGMNMGYWRQFFPEFAAAIARIGLFPKCVGFLDGTFRRTCRPSDDMKGDMRQQVCYSGHKRHHGIKFQGVVVPCGIIVHLAGPFPGHRNDQGMLNETGLSDHLVEYLGLGATTYWLTQATR